MSAEPRALSAAPLCLSDGVCVAVTPRYRPESSTGKAGEICSSVPSAAVRLMQMETGCCQSSDQSLSGQNPHLASSVSPPPADWTGLSSLLPSTHPTGSLCRVLELAVPSQENAVPLESRSLPTGVCTHVSFSEQPSLASQGDTAQNCAWHRSARGASLAVQWLGLHASIAGGTGLIPGQGTQIPHATQHGQKEKKKCPKGIASGTDECMSD